jgi:hypothetical protein
MSRADRKVLADPGILKLEFRPLRCGHVSVEANEQEDVRERREALVKLIIACAALCVALLGCGSSQPADPDVDAWEREVRILEPGQVNRPYEELGGLLEEREPLGMGMGGDDAAIDTAKRRLRRRAAELDADAVVIVECGRSVRPMDETELTRMTREVVCHGVAIRWTD